MEEKIHIKVDPPGPKSLQLLREESEYTSPAYSSASRSIVFEEGIGPFLKDVDGNTYLDFSSSGVALTNLGHSDPSVVRAIKMQSEKLIAVYDYPTPLRPRLLKKLVEIMPDKRLKRFHFLSTGGEAIEAALKLAKAYTRKYEFISFHGGYHGKPFGALSLTCYPTMGRIGFGPLMPGIIHVPYGYCYRCSFKQEYPSCGIYCVEYMRKAANLQSTGSLAGIVTEPILGAGGVVIPPPEFHKELSVFCKDNGCLFIDDEILAGFCRTGMFFGIQNWNVLPDIMIIGKGMASGIPISAVVTRDEIMSNEVWSIPGAASSTYGTNPISLAASLATIDTYHKKKLVENSRTVGGYLLRRMGEISEIHPMIGDVRGKGLLIGLEIVKNKRTREPAPDQAGRLAQEALRRGLLVAKSGYLGNVIRISPPLIISAETAEQGARLIESALRETEKIYGYPT